MERSHGGRKGGIKDNANNRLLIATRLIVAILLVGMVIIIIPPSKADRNADEADKTIVETTAGLPGVLEQSGTSQEEAFLEP
uniref:hypothetical protein n=1 Tax=Enterocloster hominis (ex Hitch et al. 2024) TaxID=1917870 RepID=UPI0010314083|nr:hypothetical protein [Lachnoclostridium pacaense]